MHVTSLSKWVKPSLSPHPPFSPNAGRERGGNAHELVDENGVMNAV
jgi:hypothetical protein